MAGPKPVHPGQRTEGFVQYSSPHNCPHHDAGHQGGGSRPVPICQENIGPCDPEALQVEFSASDVLSGFGKYQSGNSSCRYHGVKPVACSCTLHTILLLSNWYSKCWVMLIQGVLPCSYLALISGVSKTGMNQRMNHCLKYEQTRKLSLNGSVAYLI